MVNFDNVGSCGWGGLALAENFEDEIEELNERDSDGHIDGDLEPSTSLLSSTQQVGDVFGGLLQSIRQLLKVLQRCPHFVGGPRHGEGSFTELLSIAEIQFSPARRPPGTPGRAVVHPLADLRIRTVA